MNETPNDGTPMDAPSDAGSTPTPTCGPGSAFHGRAGRSGPKKGNRNAMRHGLRAGTMPEGAKYIEHHINAFRRQLEDAVMQVRGVVTLLDAANIQTAMRWERHGALALRWLRTKGDELKPTDQLAFSREIARASTERDKALAALGIDRDAADDVFERLYGGGKTPLALPAPSASADDSEAKGNTDGPVDATK